MDWPRFLKLTGRKKGPDHVKQCIIQFVKVVSSKEATYITLNHPSFRTGLEFWIEADAIKKGVWGGWKVSSATPTEIVMSKVK